MTLKVSQIKIVKKAYIYDPCEKALAAIMNLCKKHDIDCYTLSDDEIIDILAFPQDRCKDMFIFFLGPTERAIGIDTLDIANRILGRKENIPLIIRTNQNTHQTFNDYAQNNDGNSFTTYTTDTIAAAENAIKNTYCTNLPIELVRGIYSAGAESLSQTFSEIDITSENPYLVLDQSIKGSLLSIINFHSRWCQGHIIVDCAEADIVSLIINSKFTSSSILSKKTGVAQSILAELSNLILGKIKYDFFSDEDYQASDTNVQLPLLIDHNTKSISFSSVIPQVCFRYLIHDRNKAFPPFVVNLKLAFNTLLNTSEFEKSYRASSTINNRDNSSHYPIEYL